MPDVLPPEVEEQLDTLTGEITRRQEATAAAKAAEARRAAEWARAHRPEGCVDCGRSIVWATGKTDPWHPAGSGSRCHDCYAARLTFAGLPMSDPEARAWAIREVLGDTPAPAFAGHGTRPAADFWGDEWLVERAAFRWFRETPGAMPGGEQPWQYTSAAELLERLYSGTRPAPLKLLSRGRRHRCGDCGGKGEIWTAVQTIVPAPTTTDGQPSRTLKAGFKVVWTCWGRGGTCRHTEVEERVEQLQGVPVQQLPRR